MCDRSHAPAPPSRRALGQWILGAGLGLVLPGLWTGGQARAAAPTAASLPLPGPMDTCPVCGMLVAKYPEWIATLGFSDGHLAHFDGAKDMVKFLRDMPRYAKDRSADQVVALAVTDYYDLLRIDAREAVYVVGSDVLGPMGHEPVPLANAEDAATFQADHAGKATLTLEALDLDLMARLDDGNLEGLGQ